MRHRRDNRTDANQAEIVKTLRQCGAEVRVLSHLPDLGYDIEVKYRGVLMKVEVKDGSRPPSERKLTKSELEAQEWYGAKYAVVCNVNEAIGMLNSITERLQLEDQYGP